MKWSKVEFEIGERITDDFGINCGNYDKNWVKRKVKEYVLKIQEDYYFHIRNIKIKERR